MREVKVKNLNFQIKQVSDAGEFEGLAAVYAIRDEVGDVVERGAFARSIEHRGGKFPMFWQHKLDEPIGFVEVRDAEAGLQVKGKLNLEVVRAKETHALMRQALAEGAPFGLSFGFDAVKADWQGTTRHLKEVRLWEISPTLMPAHPMAQVLSVKQGMEGKPFGEFEDFDACVAANQDKEDPEGFCAFLHQQITGEWPAEKTQHGSMEECVAAHQEDDDPEAVCAELMAQAEEQAAMKARVAALFARRPQIRLSREQVAKLCPSCAEKMAALNIRTLILGPRNAKQLSEETLAALCDKFGAEEGFFTRCADGISGVDDPEAFCAWLHEQCTGLWPSEGASMALAGARYAVGEAMKVLRGLGAAATAARLAEVKDVIQALLEVDSASGHSTGDPAAIETILGAMRELTEIVRAVPTR